MKGKKKFEGTWALAPFRGETKRRPRLYRKASLRVKIAHFTSLTVWEVRGNRVAMSKHLKAIDVHSICIFPTSILSSDPQQDH